MPLDVGFGVLLLLGLAGAAGAATRFAFAEWATKRWQAATTFPLPTLLINVTGAFALGVLTTAGSASGQTRLLLGTGFLGGYTTFSTLSYDSHSLFRSGQTRAAWLNTLGSLALGVIAAALGLWCGALLGGGP